MREIAKSSIWVNEKSKFYEVNCSDEIKEIFMKTNYFSDNNEVEIKLKNLKVVNEVCTLNV